MSEGEFEKKAHISRRMIGDVDIFDLFGDITDEKIEEVASYLKAYIQNAPVNYVILNCEEVESCDLEKLASLLSSVKNVKKSSLYLNNNRLSGLLDSAETVVQHDICKTQREIIREFGPALVSSRKNGLDRRADKRFDSAVQIDLIFKNKEGEVVLENSGIITNMSDGGIFVEYLELLSSKKLAALNCLKGLSVELKNKEIFDGEMSDLGEIVRTELTGNQMALAIKFEKSPSI